MATATNCARLALALVTMMPQLVEHWGSKVAEASLAVDGSNVYRTHREGERLFCWQQAAPVGSASESRPAISCPVLAEVHAVKALGCRRGDCFGYCVYFV